MNTYQATLLTQQHRTRLEADARRHSLVRAARQARTASANGSDPAAVPQRRSLRRLGHVLRIAG